MFDRVIWPLVDTAGGLLGLLVKPALNRWCDLLEAAARLTR